MLQQLPLPSHDTRAGGFAKTGLLIGTSIHVALGYWKEFLCVNRDAPKSRPLPETSLDFEVQADLGVPGIGTFSETDGPLMRLDPHRPIRGRSLGTQISQ
jgi:hypothetical protein